MAPAGIAANSDATDASQTSARREAILNRLVSLLVLAVCLSVLGTATWLTPDNSGAGTHQQLGLPPCGFEMATGLPCATCSMTTAFAYAAHGHMLSSFVTQPAGMLLCLIMAIYTLLAAYTLVVGISLMPLLQLLWHPRSFLFLGILIGVAWGYKVLMVIMGY